ncbi:MAG TPA: ABC transporter ATP-binding protein [Atribacterota bacterium]|nr:ABC transporter ATP-binding protein [Atribacterota bacterium]HOR42454.1 ABC transporter ATP-binding protein [Atribacterota bacterium]HPK86877.1 ABC transporter ATP-binding protein [Atribacterota bacterium]
MPVEIQVNGLTKHFGGLKAVSNLSFELNKGELLGLIGPNGAGKTTVFNLMTGLLKPNSGQVVFKGKNIADWAPHLISACGIARTFQNIKLMVGMTVRENIRPAFHQKINYSMMSSLIRTPAFLKTEREMDEEIDQILDMLQITEFTDQYVEGLPYGIQRRVEIARALCLEPVVLLLDEPTAGLNHKEAKDIVEVIKDLLIEKNISMIVIEHNMRVIMSICDRIIVLNQGQLIASGIPEEIQQNNEVIRVYLGEKRIAG